MYEVEVKVPAEVDRVADRLAALDAEQTGAVVQADTYYDAPHRDFAATDEALRVRRETDKGTAEDETARMTYKGPLVDADSKTREEVETRVGDGDAADAVFRNLGFEPVATVRKERRFYAYDGYTVTLDEVTDVGQFVEVETATDNDIEAAREGAFGVLRDLALDPDDQVRTSYLGMLLSDAE